MQIGTRRGLNLNFILVEWKFSRKFLLTNNQEYCLNGKDTVLLLQLCLVVVFKIEQSVHEKVFSDHIHSEIINLQEIPS